MTSAILRMKYMLDSTTTMKIALDKKRVCLWGLVISSLMIATVMQNVHIITNITAIFFVVTITLYLRENEKRSLLSFEISGTD